MRIKSLSRLVMIITLCITLLTVSGVFATWYYVSDPTPQGVQTNLLLTANEFYWEGAEELPESDKVGENHIALIERITLSDQGLNTPSSSLSKYISDRIDDNKDNTASVAPVPGGNLKNIFNTPEIALLDFMIHHTLDENGEIIACDVYTFESALTEKQQIGKTIYPVYKTTLNYVDGMWKAVLSRVGSAMTMKYDAQQGGTRITIDPSSWIHLPNGMQTT